VAAPIEWPLARLDPPEGKGLIITSPIEANAVEWALRERLLEADAVVVGLGGLWRVRRSLSCLGQYCRMGRKEASDWMIRSSARKPDRQCWHWR